MSRTRSKLRGPFVVTDHRQQPCSSVSTKPLQPRIIYLIAAITSIIIAGVTTAELLSLGRMKPPQQATSQSVGCTTPVSHHDLLAMSSIDLCHVDIAFMNLLCAKGLPGAENLDIPSVLARLDEWAKKIRYETERHLYRVTDPRYADHYKHSEARFRAEFLGQCLHEDYGVRYNKARIDEPIADYHNSKDIFIHGMTGDNNGGTCVSISTLYVAIGRRLGYPLKLVLAKQHILCRWDDGKRERFNIENAGEGFTSFSDEHYRRFPKPLSGREVASGEYLKSLTPSEELALFLRTRADCLIDHRKFNDAKELYVHAARLMPQSTVYRENLKYLEAQLAGTTNPLIVSTTGQLIITPTGARPRPPRSVDFMMGPSGKLIMTPAGATPLPQEMMHSTINELNGINRLTQPNFRTEEKKP